MTGVWVKGGYMSAAGGWLVGWVGGRVGGRGPVMPQAGPGGTMLPMLHAFYSLLVAHSLCWGGGQSHAAAQRAVEAVQHSAALVRPAARSGVGRGPPQHALVTPARLALMSLLVHPVSPHAPTHPPPSPSPCQARAASQSPAAWRPPPSRRPSTWRRASQVGLLPLVCCPACCGPDP